MGLHVSRLLWILRVQNRLLSRVGSNPDARPDIFQAMLRRDQSERTGYWLQLTVAMGIATFGLVLGSTAVVIGAMLVAPLMTPIVALAMGLSAGSPFLVLRSVGRIGASVLYLIGGAALITSLLPFHAINPEIAARTAPTALDLFTAAFCALAGVYASLRPGSDTTSTAAGTSIGISLVPPLCVSGFGIGIGASNVATGAALLFLTNLVAIVVVGTFSFLVLGFNRVPVTELEHDELARGEDAKISRFLARKLELGFESRFGPLLRFVMPFALLAAVFAPLRKALDEVSWEVRVRTAIDSALGQSKLRIVDTRVRLDGHKVDIGIVMLGRPAEAREMQLALSQQIRNVAGVEPLVEVVAIPDADQLAGLESSLLRPQTRLAASQATLDPLAPLVGVESALEKALSGAWPEASAGPLVNVAPRTAANGDLEVTLVHLGAPLSSDAVEALSRALSGAFAREITLAPHALPSFALSELSTGPRFVALGRALSVAASVPSLQTCVSEGAAPEEAPDSPRTEMPGAAPDWQQALAEQPRLSRVKGADARLWFSTSPCEPESQGEPSPPGEPPSVPEPEPARVPAP